MDDVTNDMLFRFEFSNLSSRVYQSKSMVIIIHKVLLTSTMFHLIDLDKVAVLFYIYKSVREQVSKVLKLAS